MTAPVLTADLLETLERGWARQSAPVMEHLRPGLSPERIDDLTAPVGLRLPVEARIWWGWHDGVDVRLGPRTELGPSLPFSTARGGDRLMSPAAGPSRAGVERAGGLLVASNLVSHH